MGRLADLDPEDDTPTTEVRGMGKRLVEWWDHVADDEDRAALRKAVEDEDGANVISDRLRRSGFDISMTTVQYGIHLLRRHRWDT